MYVPPLSTHKFMNLCIVNLFKLERQSKCVVPTSTRKLVFLCIAKLCKL